MASGIISTPVAQDETLGRVVDNAYRLNDQMTKLYESWMEFKFGPRPTTSEGRDYAEAVASDRITYANSVFDSVVRRMAEMEEEIRTKI